MTKAKAEKKKPNVETISFKDNVSDNMLWDFFLEKSAVIGKSAYVKQLIKKDMDDEMEQK